MDGERQARFYGVVGTPSPLRRGLVELSNLALAIAGNRQEFPHQLDCVFL